MSRRVAMAIFLVGLAILVLPGFFAPEFLTAKNGSIQAALGPFDAPPFGTDSFGRPLLDFVQQGSRIKWVQFYASPLDRNVNLPPEETHRPVRFF